MRQKPISPTPVELRQTHVVLFAAVAAPGGLLTLMGLVWIIRGRMTSDIVLGILTLTFALWVIVGGVAAWLLVRRSERYTRLQHDFVSNVSHELRTPLTGIRMLVETLRLGRADAAQTQRAIELAARLGRFMAKIKEPLVGFLHHRPVDAGETVLVNLGG